MAKLFKIGKAAKALGVSFSTLRRWERDGKLIPERTEGSHRLYRLSQFKMAKKLNVRERKTIAYGRVSSHDQKADLERQKKVLEMYCASHGWKFELITDLGSGMNYYKKGLKKLLNAILEGDVGRLVLTHKDRLLRFGAELVLLCDTRSRGHYYKLRRGCKIRRRIGERCFRNYYGFQRFFTVVIHVKIKNY